jgi:hypothetical protein
VHAVATNAHIKSESSFVDYAWIMIEKSEFYINIEILFAYIEELK